MISLEDIEVGCEACILLAQGGYMAALRPMRTGGDNEGLFIHYHSTLEVVSHMRFHEPLAVKAGKIHCMGGHKTPTLVFLLGELLA